MYIYICILLTCTALSLLLAPPKVAEKPVKLGPEQLSFKEKLALHKKTLEEQQSSTTSAAWPPLRPSSAREGYKRPLTPELGVYRPSEQATSSAPTQANGRQYPKFYSYFYSQISEIIIYTFHLHADTPEPQLSEAQLSAEERRLERILSRPAKVRTADS